MKFVATPIGQLLGIGLLFLLVDMWGHITRAYVTNPYVDVITHVLFGVWLVLFLMYRYPAMTLLKIFIIVMAVGLSWELLEFAYDNLYALPNGINPAQHGSIDTLTDILNNALGVALAYFLRRKPAVVTPDL